MRNILLIILVSLLYSCNNSNGKSEELKQLDDKINHLEQRVDSLTNTKTAISGDKTNTGTITENGRCKGITKKGAQCKRKAKSNGYCWQHGGKED